ncbi:hypothetical protein HK100_001283 [Physocladia obscura]|uniref:glutathione gamma-glutamylcysteinyltransferase n=1 Tax=Physocladia obscura TaxID=109957 RepID=A0AAD5T7M8_9FUNG|nr:hypothetical protein HK100_001283 [Physocladia obscura]
MLSQTSKRQQGKGIKQSLIAIFRSFIIGVVTLLATPIWLWIAISKWEWVSTTWHTASNAVDIRTTHTFKDESKIKTVLSKQPALLRGLHEKSAEWQLAEGYCGSATQRVILNSIPGFDTRVFPEQKRGAQNLTGFAARMDEIAANGGINVRTSVWYGDQDYEEFLDALRKVNKMKYRVAANFLRSPLIGINYGMDFLIKVFLGGHFSPVVGFDEEEGLVAVFDVNENYGLFLVDVKQFYESVRTFDLFSGKWRGLAILELETDFD